MAMLRGASPSKELIEAYQSRLQRENEVDVLAALHKIGEMPRQDGELAFPELGSIIALMNACGVARRNRIEAEKNKRLVTWVCPDCNVTCSSWVAPGASLERRCQGIPRDGSLGQNSQGRRICGARLEVAYDEALEQTEAVYETA